jgi:hypothetical protein
MPLALAAAWMALLHHPPLAIAQQGMVVSSLWSPSIDGDPAAARFRVGPYHAAQAKGTSGFDSGNTRAKARTDKNRQKIQTPAVRPAASVVDTTVATVFHKPLRAQAAPQGQVSSGIVNAPPRKNPAPDDPFAPLGIRAGSLILRPSLDLVAGYDGNPARAARPAGSSFQQAVAGLLIGSDWSRHDFSADLKGGYLWYNKLEDFNAPDIDLKARARIDLTRQTRAEFDGGYRLAADSPSDPNLPQGIAKPPLYTESGAGAMLAHRFNRLEISVKGSVSRLSYDDAELNDGTRLDQRDRNYDQYAGLFRASYDLLPGISPFVEAGLDRRDHDVAEMARNSDGRLIRAGSSFTLPGFLVGEASAGYIWRDYDNPAFDRLSGAIYDAALTYYATPLTTVTLDARSRIEETILPGVSGTFTREANLRIDHSFRRWLSATFGIGIGRDDYDGSPRIDDRYNASAALIYKINREVHLKGEFRRQWLNSTIEGSDYTANIVSLGLRLQR